MFTGKFTDVFKKYLCQNIRDIINESISQNFYIFKIKSIFRTACEKHKIVSNVDASMVEQFYSNLFTKPLYIQTLVQGSILIKLEYPEIQISTKK